MAWMPFNKWTVSWPFEYPTSWLFRSHCSPVIKSLLYQYFVCHVYPQRERLSPRTAAATSTNWNRKKKVATLPSSDVKRSAMTIHRCHAEIFYPEKKWKRRKEVTLKKTQKRKSKLLTSQETRLPLLRHGRRRPNQPLRRFHLTNRLTNYSREYFSQYLDTRDDSFH